MTLRIIPHFAPLLALFFAASFGSIKAQQSELDFKLLLNETDYPQQACLAKNDPINEVELVLSNPANLGVEKISLTLILGDQREYFDEFVQFNDFDLASWLKEHKAYRSITDLKFEGLAILTAGGTKKLSKSICITKNGMMPSMSERGDDPSYVKIPIFFATDRSMDADAADFEDRFGNGRSSLKYGITNVSVPKIHKVGEIETPSIWKLEFWEDPSKHFMVHSIKTMDKESYFRKLANRVAKSGDKSSFLFVHGYNVSFIDAAYRTAQITYDLKFDGAPVFYSWPSKASVEGYTNDEATIEWAKFNMEQFLTDYLSRSEAEEIYLIAHSMGNRGLTRALLSVLGEKPELAEKIREVILAAPDIDAEVFRRDIAPKMVKTINKPITLYVSSNDLALEASYRVHGYRRAGDSTDGILLVDGVETIDASEVDTSFLGHSYIAESQTILDDINDMIQTARRAFLRKTLVEKQQNGTAFWKIKTGQ